MKTMKATNLKRTLGALALKPALAATTLAVQLATLPAQQAGGNSNPGVLPINSTPYGMTYSEWGAKWWSAVFSIPVVGGKHPLIDGGAFGDDERVVFLAAVTGGATVNVTVPPGAALFFPVVNSECSVIEGDPFHGDDEAELRACANAHIDSTSGLFAEIDEVPVNDLMAYRVESPLFEFGPLPENNIFGAPAGATSLAVDAGVYLFLAPLSAGKHSVHVEGTFGLSPFTINTTFKITVMP